jgi:hypothetical protein
MAELLNESERKQRICKIMCIPEDTPLSEEEMKRAEDQISGLCDALNSIYIKPPSVDPSSDTTV